MRVTKDHVTREEVIRAYAKYDRRKKAQSLLPSDIDGWPWDDPVELDSKLRANGLKSGVLAAYRDWQLAEFSLSDLLKCAIYNGIFRGEPQALCQLVLIGKVASWAPDRETGWWDTIRGGDELGVDSPKIIRPSVRSEKPAKWYIEDVSGVRLHCFSESCEMGKSTELVGRMSGSNPTCAAPSSHRDQSFGICAFSPEIII
jgi:hypothetical protein